MKLYLVETTGQGDINIDLVTEDVWNVMMDGPSASQADIDSVEAKYLAYSNKYWTPDEDDWSDFFNHHLDQDSDSSDNDRVLHLGFLAQKSFISSRDFGNWCKENPDVEIADEWSGYIY